MTDNEQISRFMSTDAGAEQLLSTAEVGSVLAFADRNVHVEPFSIYSSCNRCIFREIRDQGLSPVCPKFRCCAALHRKDSVPVRFVDEQEQEAQRAERRARERKEYEQRKMKK